jgi:branched-chain amino acid transport system ATP-binding protein
VTSNGTNPAGNGTDPVVDLTDPGVDGAARPDTATQDAPALLEIDGVSAGYNQFRALFGVSIKVRAGHATALVGPNGAGKTTLARVGSGLVAPTEGTVRINGEDVTGLRPHEYARRGIAHAPEGRSVFASLTVEENLTLTFRRRFGRVGTPDALGKAYDLFPRLGDRRKQAAGSLSGGEQRMLTLSRELVSEPRLLIADELSLGLAPIITTEVYLVLERILESGTALLIVEQHIDHALGLSSEVVALERGEVTFCGPPSEIDEKLSYFLSRH